MKKNALRRSKHYALAVVRRSQKISSHRRPLPGGAGRPKFNQLDIVTPLPTNPVWWGSMHAISSYRRNRATYTQIHTAHRQDRLQYTAPQCIANVWRWVSTSHICTKMTVQCAHYLKILIFTFEHFGSSRPISSSLVIFKKIKLQR